MKQYLNHEVFDIIGEIADQEKKQVYVIGGYVRDLLLKRNTKDIDILVVGDGIQFAQKVAKYLKLKQGPSIFKNFGTAMLPFQGIDIEFVGARKESYQSHSRKPSVEGGTLQDDQNRRDFTINTLAISLNKASYGELLDPFQGIKHLESQTIITPLEPNKTFSDDPLRMLRAIRFSTQLNFTIHEDTLNSIQENHERIKIISEERIISELNKILLSDKPSIGFDLLFKVGLLKHIMPELYNLRGVEYIDNKAHKDNFYHTIQVVDNITPFTGNLWLRWAALLHDIGKARTKKFVKEIGWTFHAHDFVGAKMVPDFFRRMKLPMGQPMKYVQKLVALHLRPIGLADSKITDSAIRRLLFDAGNDIEDLMTLAEADITSKNSHKVKKYLQNFKIVREKLIEIEKRDAIRNFQPPVSGEQIMETYNLKPCREIGTIKQRIKDAILDGKISNTHEEATEYMKKVAEELGLVTP